MCNISVPVTVIPHLFRARQESFRAYHSVHAQYDKFIKKTSQSNAEPGLFYLDLVKGLRTTSEVNIFTFRSKKTRNAKF
jgi:hypothetical protein